MTNTAHSYLNSPQSHRLVFLDPIRIWLTAMVILHHTSIAYGGSGSWYYIESHEPGWTSMLLSIMTCTDQAYFMGYFFLLAGYLMPASLMRKGSLPYLGDRLLRLWIPMILFGYILEPLTKALAVGAQGGDVWDTFFNKISHNSFGLGPLWFNQALLLGAVVWVCLGAWRPRCPWPGAFGLHSKLLLAVLGCGLLAFLLRLLIPTGQSAFGVQVGYVSSYLFLFFGGAWAGERQLLEQVNWRMAWPWLLVSALVWPSLWLTMIWFGLAGSNLWRGGWNGPALLYAFWEPLVALGVILSTLVLARRCYRQERPWLKQLAQASYATFVVHPPCVVACCWLVKFTGWPPFSRFVLAGTLSCAFAFAVGWLLARFCTRHVVCSTLVDRPLYAR